MKDWIIALVALLVLGAFLAVPIVRVGELDLAIVLGFCFLLAVVDAVLALVRRGRKPAVIKPGQTNGPGD